MIKSIKIVLLFCCLLVGILFSIVSFSVICLLDFLDLIDFNRANRLKELFLVSFLVQICLGFFGLFMYGVFSVDAERKNKERCKEQISFYESLENDFEKKRVLDKILEECKK